MTDMDDEMLPITLLADELKHEDIAVRISAIKRIRVVASALGPERCRKELIPFLCQSVDDEDEVLLSIAHELGSFVDLVGGPEHAHCLIPCLEALAATEETVVREKAVHSFGLISKQITSQKAEEVLVPMLKRLSTNEWFTSKTSACGLFQYCYPLCSDNVKHELIALFLSLSLDETPMVRRSASQQLPEFIKKLSAKEALEIVPVFFRMSSDEQDSVRLLSIPVFLALCPLLSLEELNKLVPVIRSLCADKSWRTRFMAAKHFIALSTAFQTLKIDPVEHFVNLLKDTESEVRSCAATQAPGVCLLCPSPAFIPCLLGLVTDQSQHVRCSIAQQLASFAPIYGKQITIDSLLPLFLELLRDSSSEVRLSLISKLENINEIIGVDVLHHALLPSIVELAEDKQWRVRLAIIEYVPLLAKQFGEVFFNERLISLCFSWLKDPVFTIREAACLNIKNIALLYGAQWVISFVIPQIQTIVTSPNYLHRITCIVLLSSLCCFKDSNLLELVLSNLAALSEDPVPNVRFNVLKAYIRLELSKNESITAIVNKLQADTDADVRFFASKIIKV